MESDLEEINMNASQKKEAAEIEAFKDSDDDLNFTVEYTKENCCMSILKFVNCMKLVCMISIMVYFWVWTASNRSWEVDVLEQMCRFKLLNIQFRDDKILSSGSWGTYDTIYDVSKNQ